MNELLSPQNLKEEEENKLKKISKETELSCKALGAAMFMAAVCLYMAIGAVFASVSGEDFYYHISFVFLIHGMIVSMLSSVLWVLCFGLVKPWGFFCRYLIALIILTALFGLSILMPVINSTEEHFLWIISSLISTLAFGTAIAVLSEKRLRKTGVRSVLLWELIEKRRIT